MTQEELDALMADDGAVENALNEPSAPEPKEPATDDDNLQEALKHYKNENDGRDYRADATTSWPPPPPTSDHKMVQQLDDVTRESEQKATELFDNLDSINGFLMDGESAAGNAKNLAQKLAQTFSLLHEKFPNVNTFSEMIEASSELEKELDSITQASQNGQDVVMATMDMMQYQDINRQRIERVINVMRALSKYMNSLFESSVSDEKRVSSAVYIAGDNTSENIVDNDEIEALIEQLGSKK